MEKRHCDICNKVICTRYAGGSFDRDILISLDGEKWQVCPDCLEEIRDLIINYKAKVNK